METAHGDPGRTACDPMHSLRSRYVLGRRSNRLAGCPLCGGRPTAATPGHRPGWRPRRAQRDRKRCRDGPPPDSPTHHSGPYEQFRLPRRFPDPRARRVLGRLRRTIGGGRRRGRRRSRRAAAPRRRSAVCRTMGGGGGGLPLRLRTPSRASRRWRTRPGVERAGAFKVKPVCVVPRWRPFARRQEPPCDCELVISAAGAATGTYPRRSEENPRHSFRAIAEKATGTSIAAARRRPHPRPPFGSLPTSGLLGLLGILCSLACGSAPQPPWLLLVHTRSTTGYRLAAVEIWQGSRYLGASNAQGELSAQLTVAPSTALPWSARCPGDFTLEHEGPPALTLPRHHGRTLALLRVRCRPAHQTTTIVVRVTGTDIPSLPILLDGQPLGQTERDGTAHLRLRLPTRRRIRVSLDTSAFTALRPQHPVHTFEVSEHPPLWLIDQNFVHGNDGDSRSAHPP